MNPINDLVDNILAAAEPAASPFAVAQVATVQAGAAKDGNALVAVDWLGKRVTVTYGDHYTPTVGDVVLMARTQPPSIIQRLIGTPPAA